MAVYSSVDEVIQYTGVQYADLGCTSQGALETLLNIWLSQVKSFIDKDRNRDYDADGDKPDGIDNIAMRMCSNMVSVAQIKRQTPIVMNDDFRQQIITDEIFTSAIRSDLRRFPAKPRFRMSLYKAETYADVEEES